MNVHFHVLALDGVYVRDKTSGRFEFHALPTPTRGEVADVAARTAERIEKLLPPPRLHLLRYFGVLSSHSSLRAEVVPPRAADPAAATTREAAARLLGKLGLAPQPPPAPRRAPWGQLELPFRR